MKDSKGNLFLNVNNARITLVKNRSKNKDWAATNVIRIQAYRGDGGLHMGAEIPVESHKDVTELVKAITELALSM